MLTFTAAVNAQNWFVQRHFPSASCAGQPYWEAAGNGGPNPCSVGSPCSSSVGTTPQDYLVTTCTGNAPSISITGGLRASTYADDTCSSSQLQSVTAYVLDTCISLPSASLRILCDPSAGATQMLFSDTTCNAFQSNTTLVSGAAGTCATSLDSPGYIVYTCPGSSAASTLFTGSVMIVLTFVVAASIL